MMIVVCASYDDDCEESLNANTLMTAERWQPLNLQFGFSQNRTLLSYSNEGDEDDDHVEKENCDDDKDETDNDDECASLKLDQNRQSSIVTIMLIILLQVKEKRCLWT